MSDRLPKYLTAEDQRALLDTFNRDRWTGHRNYTLVEFALSTGLRAGELVALRDENLDFSVAGGVVHVREGKGGKDRDIEFAPRLKDLLRDWLRARDALVETDVVFPTEDGTEMTTRNLGALVKKAAREAGVSEVDRVSPHTLRHTFATELLRETGNLRLVQQTLGHASSKTTEIYAQVVDEDRARALRQFRDGEGGDVDEERQEVMELWDSIPQCKRTAAKQVLEAMGG